MCNSFNHSPDCTCGFGGEGHLGRRSSSSFHDQGFLNFHYSRFQHHYDSYVNPNAKCPVCGENVFFYQSPDGGKVYFDELGPPWPKHPCTDHADRFPQPITQSTYTTPHNWEKEGWKPIAVVEMKKLESGSLFKWRDLSKQSATWGSEFFLTKSEFFWLEASNINLGKGMIFIRKTKDNMFQICQYNVSNNMEYYSHCLPLSKVETKIVPIRKDTFKKRDVVTVRRLNKSDNLDSTCFVEIIGIKTELPAVLIHEPNLGKAKIAYIKNNAFDARYLYIKNDTIYLRPIQ